MRKLITFENLYDFFASKGENYVFNAETEDAQFMVGAQGTLTFSEDENNRILPVHLQACHTEENANHYFIDENVMTNALPSLVNNPILGFMYKDDDNEWQFHEHDMHTDNNGETVYDEQIVGFIPESCNAHIEYDANKGKNYVEVDGYIIENYTKAADILRREGECSVSVEMAVNKMSYDAKKKTLDILDFVFTGVTILGKWEDGTPVKPGMAGSNIQIKDSLVSFKEQEVILANLSEQIEEIKAKLADIQNLKEGGNGQDMEDNKVLNEELDAVSSSEEEVTDTSKAEVETVVVEAEAETEAEIGTEAEVKVETEKTNEFNLDITVGSKSFSLSLDEKRWALNDLVNATYGEADNDYYYTYVFDDDGYVIMVGMCVGKAFKQTYVRENDTFVLTGDRISVKQIWATDDEIAQLDSMKSRFADVSAKLQKYEEEPQKMEILNSDEYSSVATSEEFVGLKETNAHFDMSIDDVRAKADEILLNAAKSGSLNFNEQSEITTFKKFPVTKNKGTGRYGKLFSK